MKKIVENVLGIVMLIAFMVGSAETPTGGIDLAWTCGWFAVVVLCAIALNRLDKSSTKNL